MKKSILLLAIVLLTISSCVESSNKYKQMKAERDSLMMITTENSAEINEMMLTLGEVESGFDQMKTAESFLIDESKNSGEPSETVRQRIKEQMELLNNTLNKNREKLALLEKQMKQSKSQNSVLKATVKRLNEELENKTLVISSLQEELSKRNIRIDELNQSVSTLNQEVSELNQENQSKEQKINEQDKSLHTVFYCFGTSSELKNEQIITGGGLFRAKEVMQDNFNKSYFTKVDSRELKTIPLMCKKAKILTNQPKDSYTLAKGNDGFLILEIINAERFWSMGKYLVIQVN